jgi:hypothetical protein
MFARIKKAGRYEYLQIVENHREHKKSVQRVIATLGRIDQLKAKGEIEGLLHSLSRFSEKPLLVLSEKSDGVRTRVRKIGPSLAFEGLWRTLGIDRMLHGLATGRGFAFPLERATFLTVLYSLSGDDFAPLTGQDGSPHTVHGADSVPPDHISQALAFLGGEAAGTQALPIPAMRTAKDAVEEGLFRLRPDQGGSRNKIAFLYAAPGHPPQEADRAASSRIPGGSAGIVVDAKGYPICSEVWPDALETGSLSSFTEHVKDRFAISSLCFVSERKAIDAATVACLRKEQIPYILGAQAKEPADPEKGHDETWIIETNTGFDAAESALRYKKLEDICLILGNAYSLLRDRPALSRRTEITKGLVFSGFLALVLRNELDHRMRAAGHSVEWARIKDDLDTLQEITIEDNGRKLFIRTRSAEGCKKILEAAGAVAGEPAP